MADYTANVAPFINVTFYVTAQAGVYPSGGYHSGLDISTGSNDNVYSIVNGTVIEVGWQENGYGNYIIIKDNNSNYAFLYGHLRDVPLKQEGDIVQINEQVGVEGTTGNSTGIHTHVEMEDYVNNGNKWIHAGNDPDMWGVVYLDPTTYMGFPNKVGISVIYDGNPITPNPPTPTPTTKKKNSIKWLIAKSKKINIKT